MTYNTIFLTVEIIIFGISAYLFSLTAEYYKKAPKVRFKTNRFHAVTDFVKETLYKKDTEEIFLQSGFRVSSTQYQIIRYSLFVAWLGYLLYSKFHNPNFSRSDAAFMIAMFFATSPKMRVSNINTPFSYFIDLFTFEHRTRKNKEIYSALLQLKNLSIAKKGIDIGSIFVIEELTKYTKLTKPIFLKLLSMWFENKKKEACEYFGNAIDTPEGRKLADLLIKLDSLNPDELIEQLELYLDSFDEERQTRFEKKSERISNIFYALASFAVIVVFVNFIVVVVFIDSLDKYKTLYNH